MDDRKDAPSSSIHELRQNKKGEKNRQRKTEIDRRTDRYRQNSESNIE